MSIAICPEKPKKLLIIFSSGGGGLIQAAVAKEQEIKAKDPQSVVVNLDLMKDCFGKRLGSLFVNFWNRAQQKGDLKAQRLCIHTQFIFDLFAWPRVFIWSLCTLFKEKADRIIDTQPIGTSALLKAIRIYNLHHQKNLYLEKVLVDLPTKKATHFFRSIRKLSSKDRALLKLITIQPLLEKGQTASQFWEETCNLSEKHICYEEVYVRQSFRRFKGKPRPTGAMDIAIAYKTAEELDLMKKSIQRGPIQATILEKSVQFQIAPEDKMATILLGSQPAEQATLAYVKRFLQAAKEIDAPQSKVHFFVFAADHHPGKNSLFQKIVESILRIKDYPSQISVIPFSFQTDEAIAPLFYRSDLTCTRSGGQTAMELICVSSGQIWIHSEAKKKDKKELSMEALLAGIPGWESASASYLQKLHGAEIVTPDSVIPLAKKFLS